MKGIRRTHLQVKSKPRVKAKLKAKVQKKAKSKLVRVLSFLAGITVIAILIGALSGCDGNINKRDIGVGVGAVAGGLIGSTMGGGGGRIATTVVGAGAGALAGGYLGGQMDDSDQGNS
jgi:hypothetical protein